MAKSNCLIRTAWCTETEDQDSQAEVGWVDGVKKKNRRGIPTGNRQVCNTPVIRVLGQV